jgi:1,4-alpha-glucan branching enzyme
MIQKTLYKTKDYSKVKFSVSAENAKKVEILGLNNDWKKPVALAKKKDGTFSLEINLPKNSQHEFKYLIDKKEWLNDTDADGQTPNAFGGTNSVIHL